MRKIIVIILIFTSLSSCKEEKSLEDYGYLFSKVMLSPEGHVRGSSIGDNMPEVRARETAPLTDESDHYLYYSGTLNENGHFIVSYYFNENSLYEINLDIFTNDPATAEEIYIPFQAYLQDRYGESEKSEEFTHWETSNNDYDAEIFLNREIQEDLSNYITLSVQLKNDL